MKAWKVVGAVGVLAAVMILAGGRLGSGGRHGITAPVSGIVVVAGFVNGNLKCAIGQAYQCVTDALNQMDCSCVPTTSPDGGTKPADGGTTAKTKDTVASAN
jgi:hypothetical protein